LAPYEGHGITILAGFSEYQEERQKVTETTALEREDTTAVHRNTSQNERDKVVLVRQVTI